jgi:hypothetical protein
MKLTKLDGRTKAVITILIITFFTIVVSGLALNMSLHENTSGTYQLITEIFSGTALGVMITILILLIIDSVP